MDQLIAAVADEHGLELGQGLAVPDGQLKAAQASQVDESDLSARLARLRDHNQ